MKWLFFAGLHFLHHLSHRLKGLIIGFSLFAPQNRCFFFANSVERWDLNWRELAVSCSFLSSSHQATCSSGSLCFWFCNYTSSSITVFNICSTVVLYENYSTVFPFDPLMQNSFFCIYN